VALILRFEEAHTSAANAMLKTLEEPPDRVIVILTARSVESLLPTIPSRCEVLRLRSLSVEETAVGLQSIRKIPQDVAVRLAHISDGRPGYAICLYDQPALLEKREAILDELIQLLAASRRERFVYAKSSSEDKESLRITLQVWLTFWRDVLICTSGLETELTNLEYSQQIQRLASLTGMSKAELQVRAIERTMEQVDRNVNARLALEVLVMDFPKISPAG
jgi:DNA polymerase-3 subunit delta'